MKLLELQSELGRLVREPGPNNSMSTSASSELACLADTPGFRFTVEVQRSWCAARCTKAAWLTLSILRPAQRDALISSWVNGGGGTASFVASESDAFLNFISEHLIDPSHELTICRMEQATLRASEGARKFVRLVSELEKLDCELTASPYASVVQFHAEPQFVLSAVDSGTFPPLLKEPIFVLFAPGLELLSRFATNEEVRLLSFLSQPRRFRQLLEGGYRTETIEELFAVGATSSRECQFGGSSLVP
jgi:hypothetical protein